MTDKDEKGKNLVNRMKNVKAPGQAAPSQGSDDLKKKQEERQAEAHAARVERRSQFDKPQRDDPPEQASKPAAAPGKKHTVAAGDTLSAISLKHYGTANRWKEIYAANKAIIGDDPGKIKAGQVLTIPA